MGVVLVHELPRLVRFRPGAGGVRAARESSEDEWGAFTLLGLVISLRSFVYFGFVTFIPLYYIHVLHAGKATGGAALTVMLAGGAAGTLVGGRLADRFGRRTVLIGSMILLPPLIVCFLLAGTALGMVLAAVIGAVTIATFAVTIVMGQELLPGRIGVASGVTIGLSIGLGGAGAPLLGLLADAHGLRAVFELLVLFPVLALALALALPVRRDVGRDPSGRGESGSGVGA
jgi:FSR family fosmidomycin resistance protein-like MFS transporter